MEDGKDKDGNPKYKTVKEDNIINNPAPIWNKSPKDLKDEDYKNFYKELYPFSEEPLFWIHLNVDYPFNLTGILFFPKIKNDFEVQKQVTPLGIGPDLKEINNAINFIINNNSFTGQMLVLDGGAVSYTHLTLPTTPYV